MENQIGFKSMTRSLPYPMNDPKDYSMLTQPKLRLNDTVIVWDEDEGGEWAQARVVDATFNRGKKCWEYSSVVEFVDEEDVKDSAPAGMDVLMFTTHKDRKIVIKDWHYFSDEEIKRPLDEITDEDWLLYREQYILNNYIVIRK